MESRFRYPAEWEPHAAVWLAWPSHQAPWEDTALADVQAEFAALCRAIADPDPASGQVRGEPLQILVPDETHEADAARALDGLGARFHHVPFGDIWLRDTAPLFLHHVTERVASVFRFNGWGDKFVYPEDDKVADRVAHLSRDQTLRHDWVLEGGSLESDGEGTLLTTRECLLNPNRNPHLSREEIEERLELALGIRRILWLDRGLIGDHTDGHIDNLARFVAPGRVLCMAPSGEDDPNREVLEETIEALGNMSDGAGRRLEVVTLPSPGRVLDRKGEIMAASHVNFYLANTTVVVPLYPGSDDKTVCRVLGECFPGRRVIGVPAWNILHGGGSLHCITQQVPLRP
ncbi:MAG: agmatine deiminase family protein [Verrucomicrobiota bacterium]